MRMGMDDQMDTLREMYLETVTKLNTSAHENVHIGEQRALLHRVALGGGAPVAAARQAEAHAAAHARLRVPPRGKIEANQSYNLP